MLVEIEPGELEPIRWSILDGKVYIAVFRVIYGYRLRAWQSSNEWSVDLDWCLGAVSPTGETVQTVRDRMVDLIENNAREGLPVFHGIPGCSRVKPIFNDREFCNAVGLS